MNNEFIHSMEKNSNAELMDIILNKNRDYVPEAIEAAKFVLKSRNIPERDLLSAKIEAEEYEKIRINKANETLSKKDWGSVVLNTFVSPLAFFGGYFLEVQHLHDQGYIKKSKQLKKVQQIGCLAWVLFFTVVFIIAFLY